MSCNTNNEVVKKINARLVQDKDIFDEVLKGDKSPLSIYKAQETQNTKAPDAPFSVKVGDTTLMVQSSEDPSKGFHQFRYAKFLNKQETCMMVSCVDSITQLNKFFLIVAKGANIEAIDLYRPTDDAGKAINNQENRIGGEANLFNNDIVLRKSDLKVFFLKRLKETERLPGNFVLQSPDRKTLVFQQLPDKLYQVNYLSGAVSTLTVDAGRLGDSGNFHTWIRSDFTWKKDKAGNSFLKQIDENEVVEMF